MDAHGTVRSMAQALALAQRGRLADAEELLAQICAQDPENDKAWLMRGAIRSELGDAAGAIHYLSTALELVPGNAPAHFTLCKLHYSRGNLAEAIFHADSAVALEPEHGEAWLALGSLCADAGRFQQAERASRVAMKLLPGIVEPKVNLVNALISQGKQDEAIALCYRIKADDSKHPGIWHSLGLAFKALGRMQDAGEALTRATALDPANAAAFCALGEIKAAQNEVAQALALYRKSRELDPADPRSHFQLGKVLLANCSARHQELLSRLQRDYQYHDVGEATAIARELARDFRYDDAAAVRALVRFFEEYDPSQLYPAEWWASALARFGDRRRASDTVLRSVYSTVFSWSLPCREALDQTAAFCGKRLASYGSGAGYWEWLLAKHHGIDVVCHDKVLRHRFVPTDKVPHSAATVDPEDTIFLAWLPGEISIDPAIESLLNRVAPGQKLILVGEPADDSGHPRTCGTRRFFQYLQGQFETTAIVPLASYAYFQDRVEFLVRR